MIHLDFTTTRLFEYMPKIILPAVGATVRMLFFSMTLGLIIGILVSIVFVLTSPHGLKPNHKVYNALGFIVNMLRAFPVIILIVAISPLSRAIVGTSIGEKAAIVPLTLAAFPVIARYIEASILEIDQNLILAARSFGASDRQIIFRILFPEAMPSIVSGLTTTTILFLGATTLAGAVGAGGLGAVALTYGYQRFDDVMMYAVVLILFVMVLIIQGVGEFIYRKLKIKTGVLK